MSDMMEKRVLALKYRPHRFEDLVGQSTVSQTLSLALDSNRLSHAYLFSGLRGSGKTSTARIMAKALLCFEGPTSKPCEVCDNCKSANANRHLDIIEMDAASNRGIDDIKDLIEHTKYKPSSARFKVFIIDEVHMLTTQAFNALLKTLEEPPGFVKFILATTDPLKLPATILSRTQHFRFNKIASSDVIHHLSHILNEENIDYESSALEILARTGQGSLRDTLTMLDQAIIFSKGKVTTSAVVDMLGLIDPEVMDKIFTVVLNKGDITTIVRELENYEVSQVCDEMTIFLKHKMLAKDTRFDLLLFDRFFRILSDAKQLLAMNSDGGFVLILTLMKMVEAVDIKTIDDIINQIQRIEPSQDVAPMVVQSPVAPVAPLVEPTPVIQEPTPVKEAEAVVSAPIVEEKIVEEVKNETPIEERSTVEEELKNIVVEGVVNSNPFDDMPSSAPSVTPIPEPIMMPDDLPETKIEELTPADEVLVESTSFVDLGLVDAIETVSYPNPFDEGMSAPIENQPVPEQTQAMQTPTPVVEQKQEELITPPAPNESLETVVDEAVKEIVSQEVEVQAVEQQVPFNPSADVEVVPVEEPIPSKKTEVVENVLYIKLTEKVYDRDYSLGECFEKNFIFRGFTDNKLSIASYAQGDDRKFLYKHFALIRTFAQDIFGNEVELDFKKEEPRQA
ncbi:DNA polymerase III subunit gamma/tau [Poseidonibacter lekithochrous]|uniref:DNA polymerase III subunit gamma/tau n=1 Tax=Poseidonibacter lekithochrous TaxID=1904463 RepID=UPI000AF1022A|nr:DNA polymerase III subunit gamma/tau [Poseidonibacter lekithochrous]QKJ24243.1 DNA polymerase III, gamma and tau subunits [Poseidonibacter lekithochrous]